MIQHVIVNLQKSKIGLHNCFFYKLKLKISFFKKIIWYRDKTNNPLHRLKAYLKNRGWWDDERYIYNIFVYIFLWNWFFFSFFFVFTNQSDAELHKNARKEVLKAMKVADKAKKPPVDQLFTDVYDVCYIEIFGFFSCCCVEFVLLLSQNIIFFVFW